MKKKTWQTCINFRMPWECLDEGKKRVRERERWKRERERVRREGEREKETDKQTDRHRVTYI